jgi:hypothetical protein
MLKFQPHKDYDLSNLLKKSCQKILKILTVVACLSSCNPLWVLWNFRGEANGQPFFGKCSISSKNLRSNQRISMKSQLTMKKLEV